MLTAIEKLRIMLNKIKSMDITWEHLKVDWKKHFYIMQGKENIYVIWGKTISKMYNTFKKMDINLIPTFPNDLIIAMDEFIRRSISKGFDKKMQVMRQVVRNRFSEMPLGKMGKLYPGDWMMELYPVIHVSYNPRIRDLIFDERGFVCDIYSPLSLTLPPKIRHALLKCWKKLRVGVFVNV